MQIVLMGHCVSPEQFKTWNYYRNNTTVNIYKYLILLIVKNMMK